MNRCPQCHSEFADDILYCLNDGRRLEPAGEATSASPVSETPRRLAELLDGETPMAVARAARIAIALCDAVAKQRQAVGLSDVLDPQAIAIAEPAGDEQPRLKIMAGESSAAHSASAPSLYSAPEIVSPREASVAADVYGIGAITYKMLTGEPPFAAATTAALRVKQLLERPRPLRHLRPDIPPRLETVILRALEKEPSARPASVAELRRETADALAEFHRQQDKPATTGIVAAPPDVAAPPLTAPSLAAPPLAAPAPLQSAPPVPPSMAMAAQPSAAALPSPAASSPRAMPARRMVIMAALALLALLLAFTALAIYLTQSRESNPPEFATTSAGAPDRANEPANANATAPQPVAAPTNRNAPATANRNAPRKVKERPPPPTPNAAPPMQPAAAAPPTIASAPPPAPDARLRPPPANENTSAPPTPAAAPAPTANKNTSVAAKPRRPAKPQAQPRPRPASSPVPAAASPSPQPAPTVKPPPLALAKAAHRGRYVGYGRWIMPALLLCLALAVAAFALSLLRYRKLPPPALQIAAAPASVASAPAASREAEAHPPALSPRDTQAGAPAPQTLSAPQANVPTVLADTPPPREILHRCPACQTEYSPSVRFCVHDGTTLQAASKTVPPKDEPSFYDLQTLEPRKRCPVCGTEYPLTKKFCRYDGEKLVEMKSSKPPAVDATQISPVVIGQYRCFARLGEGGMGVVYKAQHIHLKRLSAIKVLLPQTALLPDAVQMFRREAQLASSINHPNSVIIYDYGELDTSLFYLAMEFIAGASLAEIIAPDGEARPLPLARALDITRQVAEALDAAHQLGIVHRDLKPQNVMITMRASGADFVKVVDFGIARSLKLTADYATLPGVIVGTPAYMSPEQARGAADLDARADIYSLGIMVYQMLSGALPFSVKGISVWQQIDRRAQQRELPSALHDLRPELRIPRAVNDTVMRALDPDRSRRYPSALDFLHDLTQSARPAH
jgi:serine/threonine protein kinase